MKNLAVLTMILLILVALFTLFANYYWQRGHTKIFILSFQTHVIEWNIPAPAV